MTASTRLERNLPGILDDLSAGPAPEYLDDVFARTAPHAAAARLDVPRKVAPRG